MIGKFFSSIILKIAQLVGWFSDLAVNIFHSAWLIFTDVFCWLFESFMKISVSAVGAVDVSSVNGFAAQGWGSLTSEVLSILGVLGVGTAITIISGAIAIRLALQLIPFVRLGS